MMDIVNLLMSWPIVVKRCQTPIWNLPNIKTVVEALRKRFAKFDLELHPEKTRVISFGRFELEQASKENRRANTFDFLGFNHYCGKNRKGKFILLRKTSNKQFRMKCKEMNNWLRKIRNYMKTKE